MLDDVAAQSLIQPRAKNFCLMFEKIRGRSILTLNGHGRVLKRDGTRIARAASGNHGGEHHVCRGNDLCGLDLSADASALEGGW